MPPDAMGAKKKRRLKADRVVREATWIYVIQSLPCRPAPTAPARVYAAGMYQSQAHDEDESAAPWQYKGVPSSDAGSGSDAALVPVAALNPYGSKWTIKVRSVNLPPPLLSSIFIDGTVTIGVKPVGTHGWGVV